MSTRQSYLLHCAAAWHLRLTKLELASCSAVAAALRLTEPSAVCAAVCAYLTQLTITLGLQRVGATLGTALSYLTVVWGMILGRLVFHEVLPCLTLPGGLLRA